MKMCSALGLATAAGLALSSTAFGQYQIVNNISGTFTDIAGAAGAVLVTTGDDSSGPATVSAAASNALAPAGTLNCCTNGHAGYGLDTQYFNGAIPSGAFYGGQTAFAVFWDDMITQAGANAGVWTQTTGTTMIVQWNNMDHYFTSPSTGTYQMKIYGGGSGPGGSLVQYIYNDVDFGTADSFGASATVGYQTSATSGNQYSFNQAVIQNGLALSVIPLSNDPGACCLTNGTCVFVSQISCIGQGGTFTAIGTLCANANCPQPSRCCTFSGCTLLTQAACLAAGGIFSNGQNCSAPCPPSAEAHVMDILSTPQRMIQFPPDAPNFNNVVGPNGNFFGFAMDFNGAGTTLYGITYNNGAAPCTFGTIDATTGVFTAIGPISGPGAIETNFGGLTYDTTNNTMYAQAVFAQGNNMLYTINLATGATTTIGNMTDPAALMIDTAVNNAGAMYTHDIVSDQLYSVNKATAATTVIGPTGQAANFAQGMDFDPIAGGNLYATMYTAASGPYAIFNLTTGNAVVVQANTGSGEYEIAIRRSATGSSCYANCDGSTQVPFLNVLDFNCFVNQFQAGNSYANCDGSTTPPVLNVLDFNCFVNAFQAGCSAP
jgi:hypothetical protein